jgi:hypothetical protein
MPEVCACHSQNSTALFCIGIDHHSAKIVVTNMNELGGER